MQFLFLQKKSTHKILLCKNRLIYQSFFILFCNHIVITRVVPLSLISSPQSNTIIYNNFPWPELPKNESKTAVAGVSIAYTAIENAAKTVLDERTKHQTGDNPASLADLYDPLTMPPALLKAHQKLDAAVDKAYEASGGKKAYKSDAERVAFLFDLYQRMTSLLPADGGKAKRRTKLAG